MLENRSPRIDQDDPVNCGFQHRRKVLGAFLQSHPAISDGTCRPVIHSCSPPKKRERGGRSKFSGAHADGALERENPSRSRLSRYQMPHFEEENEAWFDAENSLKDMLGSLRENIETSNAVVTHDELPRFAQLRFAFRACCNLIGNVIKYVAPRLHILARATPDEWIFSVKDNGIGINPQYQDRIFEPFKRLHNASQYAGTGMARDLQEDRPEVRRAIDG